MTGSKVQNRKTLQLRIEQAIDWYKPKYNLKPKDNLNQKTAKV